MINLQAPEKKAHNAFVEVHSIFYTIQGEGPFSGTPAVFIRLAGCNLQCPACDTEYTSKRSNLAPSFITKEAVESLNGNPVGLVVITGGEPFRQDIAPLVRSLLTRGFYVQIETNGTLPPPQLALTNRDTQARYGAYIVVSPKGSRVNPDTALVACAYKYVMDYENVDLEDGLPTKVLGHPCRTRVARPLAGTPIYLQPADHQHEGHNHHNLRACIKSCMAHGYILQLQMHKLIGME